MISTPFFDIPNQKSVIWKILNFCLHDRPTYHQNYTKVGLSWSQKNSICQIMDFWLGISKNASNIIWRSIKNTHFSRISWVRVKNWACHVHLKFKIEMAVAGSIFGWRPPNFARLHIFWRQTNNISVIFWYS